MSVAGFGENSTRDKLNKLWGEDGLCVRLIQRIGALGIMSDLILFTRSPDMPNFSIEIKSYRNTRRLKNGKRGKAKPLSFNMFNTSTSKHEEFPFQLERQVKLSKRAGLVPVVILFVRYTNRASERYVFPSCVLYERWKRGDPSIKSDEFDSLHDNDLEQTIFRGK